MKNTNILIFGLSAVIVIVGMIILKKAELNKQESDYYSQRYHILEKEANKLQDSLKKIRTGSDSLMSVIVLKEKEITKRQERIKVIKEPIYIAAGKDTLIKAKECVEFADMLMEQINEQDTVVQSLHEVIERKETEIKLALVITEKEKEKGKIKESELQGDIKKLRKQRNIAGIVSLVVVGLFVLM